MIFTNLKKVVFLFRFSEHHVTFLNRTFFIFKCTVRQRLSSSIKQDIWNILMHQNYWIYIFKKKKISDKVMI